MDDDEDDYIFYGTPLPEIEDEAVLRKKAAKDLEVRDEKGRQRFHGAFTGGFSAGYFNTVGTKEGWAPSTFVSSRNKMADRVQQNPEDFMDTEDFGEFGIATKRIHTTSNFVDSNAESRKRKYPELDSVIPGEAPLKDIVKPVRESIGIKILNKLGWRLGQGIGPRVKKQATSKVYGCAPFPSASNEDDPMASSYTFAPVDTTAQFFQPKDNVFGLGYSGLSKESVLGSHIDLFNPTSTKSFLKKDKKKLTISGQAFGVGAFEDDDEDIYSKDDMSQYDFSELNPKDSSRSSKDKNSKKQMNSTNQLLEGFCRATQPPPSRKHHPPPELPQRYRPVCSTLPKIPPPPAEQKFASRHALSASDRSLLLGEKNFQAFKMPENKKDAMRDFDLKPKNSVPSNNSGTFRPFSNDESKQKRYEDYVRLKNAGQLDKFVHPSSSMTEWEKQQELLEFSRSALLFRPLPSVLSAKFESRSHLNVEHEVMDAIVKAKKENSEKTVATEKRKLVGLSSRESSEWHPASLLCKRFNVPNPFPNSGEPSSNPVKSSKSLFDHISFLNNGADQRPSSASERGLSDNVPDEVPSTRLANKSSENIAPIEEKTQIKDVESSSEKKRPPLDFFRDIFGSSEDEDDGDSKPERQPTQSPRASSDATIEKDPSSEHASPVSEKRVPTKKPGFGVFANLDLDALNQRTPVTNVDSFSWKEMTPSDQKDPEEPEAPEASQSEVNSSLHSDLYGPELPPGYSASRNSSSPEIVHQTLARRDTNKHPKHKAKHKHKHHKHKSKKKKKKKSSHKSSDSSVDSDEDIPDALIIEKFKKVQKFLR